jgi:[ribosomal protein S5]-alanine N-acetyltransferase
MRDAGLEGLTTERLSLRRFTPGDEALLLALNSDAEVMRYLGGPLDAEQNYQMLHGRILRYYDEHPGFGVWATLKKHSGRCVGFHLLNHVQGETDLQVGYRLFRRDWGQGYASEMTRALLRYGFVDRGLSVITANAHLDNHASQRVLLKCGLYRRGERHYPHPAYARMGAVAYFERDAAGWLADNG